MRLARATISGALWASVALLLGSCESRLGERYPGGTIHGTAFYEGEVARSFAEPIMLAVATVALSSEDPPHALQSRTLTLEELDEPLEFFLDPLPPGRYYISVTIADAANFTPVTSPRGFFPDSCSIFGSGRSLTLEQNDERVLDVRIYDELSDDPCFMPQPDGGL